jgi:chromate transporter
MLSMIQQEVVEKNRWISLSEFTDIIAISQITPGPIAINSATYIGYSATNSVLGAAFATLGVVTPSVIVMIILIKFLTKFSKSPYVENAFKGLRLTVIGLILGAAFSLIGPEVLIDYKSYILVVVSLIGLLKYKVGPIPLVVASGVVGVLLYS